MGPSVNVFAPAYQNLTKFLSDCKANNALISPLLLYLRTLKKTDYSMLRGWPYWVEKGLNNQSLRLVFFSKQVKNVNTR